MDQYLVKPRMNVNLSEWDPYDKTHFEYSKETGKLRLFEKNTELMELQNILYAEHKHKVLIVLQGMDTSGEEGTIILKFFLHIDLDEQKERQQARLDDPHKLWKFRKGDLDERKLWPEYIQAYAEVLSKTSTSYSPWCIVPSNRKWNRNLIISSIMIETLKKLKMVYPAPDEDLEGIIVE